jgi:hypothetical protein
MPYGFSPIDIGITKQDLIAFNVLAIQKTDDYNECGKLLELEDNIIAFLHTIETNKNDVIQQVASKIVAITNQITAISEQEFA